MWLLLVCLSYRLASTNVVFCINVQKYSAAHVFSTCIVWRITASQVRLPVDSSALMLVHAAVHFCSSTTYVCISIAFICLMHVASAPPIMCMSAVQIIALAMCNACPTESRRKLVMHLGMFDDLWSAASLVPFAREDGLDVFLIGNRNCPPFVRGSLTCQCQHCKKICPCHSMHPHLSICMFHGTCTN